MDLMVHQEPPAPQVRMDLLEQAEHQVQTVLQVHQVLTVAQELLVLMDLTVLLEHQVLQVLMAAQVHQELQDQLVLVVQVLYGKVFGLVVLFMRLMM